MTATEACHRRICPAKVFLSMHRYMLVTGLAVVLFIFIACVSEWAAFGSLSPLSLWSRKLTSISSGNSDSCSPGIIRILFWDPELGNPGPTNLSCNRRCVFTSGRSRYDDSSDAVVFLGDRMSMEDFPARRSRGQKWIYRTMEPPTNVFPYTMKMVQLRRQRHLYNLTSTFDSSSDVPTPYFAGNCSIDDSKFNVTEVTPFS